jgi:hypothetical protein
LALISTTVTFLGPLIYIQNKEVIDAQLEQGRNLMNQQATQIRDLAAHHTGNATKSLQTYAGQATSKAQETINSYRGRSASPEVKKEDFPAAPKHDLKSESKEPLAEPVAA